MDILIYTPDKDELLTQRELDARFVRGAVLRAYDADFRHLEEARDSGTMVVVDNKGQGYENQEAHVVGYGNVALGACAAQFTVYLGTGAASERQLRAFRPHGLDLETAILPTSSELEPAI